LQRAKDPNSSSFSVSSEGAYLITGGLGSLGQQLARWLVKHGARHVVLTSRTGSSERSMAFEQELKATGATLSVVKADVADETQMSALFESFGRSLPALRGVIHAAGVVSTQALSVIDEGSMRAVLKPKVAGAWLLHRLTQNLSLDFFVLFSSSSAILGSSGLGHYAAANSYLDTLAHIRRSMDLPALSVNWGWWAGAGMATADLEEQFKQIGQNAMPVELGLEALDALICSDAVQVMVAAIDWAKFKPIYEAKRQRPLIERIHVRDVEQEEQKAAHTFVDTLMSVPVAQRTEKLRSHVRDQVAHVLGFGASDTIDPQQGFFSIGMDSVMAVQLRTRLETSLGQTLPSTLAFEYPTIESLTNYLAGEVLKLDESRTESPMDDSQAADTIGSQTPLSEEELLSKLDDELAAFNNLTDGN
jgi:acyl carrier protein